MSCRVKVWVQVVLSGFKLGFSRQGFKSKVSKVQRNVRFKGSPHGKKNVFFWALPERGGGGDPCPNFFTLFHQLHLWSIK